MRTLALIGAAREATAPTGAQAFQDKTEQQRLDRIIVDSLLKQGETLAGRGYYSRAANYYLRIDKAFLVEHFKRR